MEHEEGKRHQVSRRVTEVDGSMMEVFALPTDAAVLEALLRDLFENHWRDITFGPIIQGAAWEMQAQAAPTYVGMLDGYITVAFGAPHFHICIGEHKGTHGRPVTDELARHRRTARADWYRRSGSSSRHLRTIDSTAGDTPGLWS